MDELRQLPIPLLVWYRENARVLPWRSDPTPYHVWVSEIMLQQTRVAAVLDYYRRFLEAAPDVAPLAALSQDRLMKLWQGLGYYSRARNMQKAAVQIVEDYGGVFPNTYEAIRGLAGVGDYTAGAISSIAFGLPVPAVDGNVLRVISRVLADREDILKQSVKRQMEELLRSVMPEDKASEFNQGLMEIGAMVCIPGGQPKCRECPLESVCLAKRQGLTEVIPYKAPKKSRKVEERTVLLIESGQQIAVQKRPDHGLLASLYEFPNYEGTWKKEDVAALLEQEAGCQGLAGDIEGIEKAGEAKHIFSHVEWHMTGYRIQMKKIPSVYVAVEKREIFEKYPLPSAFYAYTKLIRGQS